MKNKENNSIIIAMDIDDFITTMEIDSLREAGKLDPIHHRDELFIQLNFTHRGQKYDVENLLTPGCAEFLRFLFDQENVRPAFFSAGVQTRNLHLAEKIVKMLIETGGDPEWIKRYDVYSREDCFDTEMLRHFDDSQNLREKFQPKNFFGNYKKDLRMIYYGPETFKQMVEKMYEDPSILYPDPEKDDENLKNIILLEEDPSYLLKGQEKNLVLCPTYSNPYPYPINYQGEDLPDKAGERDYDRFKSGNTIFYAAGLMNRAFERLSSEDKTLPEILWEEQGPTWFDGDYERRYPLHFFTEGRKVLRKYNPDLNFVIPGEREKS